MRPARAWGAVVNRSSATRRARSFGRRLRTGAAARQRRAGAATALAEPVGDDRVAVGAVDGLAGPLRDDAGERDTDRRGGGAAARAARSDGGRRTRAEDERRTPPGIGAAWVPSRYGRGCGTEIRRCARSRDTGPASSFRLRSGRLSSRALLAAGRDTSGARRRIPSPCCNPPGGRRTPARMPGLDGDRAAIARRRSRRHPAGRSRSRRGQPRDTGRRPSARTPAQRRAGRGAAPEHPSSRKRAASAGAAGICRGGQPRSTWTSPPGRARRTSCAGRTRRRPPCTRPG